MEGGFWEYQKKKFLRFYIELKHLNTNVFTAKHRSESLKQNYFDENLMKLLMK